MNIIKTKSVIRFANGNQDKIALFLDNNETKATWGSIPKAEGCQHTYYVKTGECLPTFPTFREENVIDIVVPFVLYYEKNEKPEFFFVEFPDDKNKDFYERKFSVYVPRN